MYLGDFILGQTVDFIWNTAGADGASITRATDGTISVYKGNNTTQTTTGVTDTEDFDSLTGVHHCRIVTTDSFYVARENYMVVLSAATIDGQTINACIASFSIENRAPARLIVSGEAQTGSTATTIETNLTETTNDHYNGRMIQFVEGALIDQMRAITDYNGTTKALTVESLTESPANGDAFRII